MYQEGKIQSHFVILSQEDAVTLISKGNFDDSLDYSGGESIEDDACILSDAPGSDTEEYISDDTPFSLGKDEPPILAPIVNDKDGDASPPIIDTLSIDQVRIQA